MLAIALGLGAAAAWGTSDFIGGLQSRRLAPLAVMLWSQVVGAVVMTAVLVIVRPSFSPVSFGWGAVAGTVGGIALLFLYQGLAVGPMSLVATLAAAGAAVPVVVDVVGGKVPGVLTGLGLVAAMLGVVLVSRRSEPVAAAVGGQGARPGGQGAGAGAGGEEAYGSSDLADRAHRRAVLLGAVAALGFGLAFVFIDRGTHGAGRKPLWAIAGTRVGALAALGAILPFRPVRVGRLRWPVAAVGVFDVGATLLFGFGSAHGDLAVVSVLSSQFPGVTVLLARVLLGERLRPIQLAGLVMALVGVALLSAG